MCCLDHIGIIASRASSNDALLHLEPAVNNFINQSQGTFAPRYPVGLLLYL